MSFQGDLDTFGLATIFQTLTANQQSGTLHVYDEHSERYLVFSEGSIRTVSTGRRQNVSLGEILVARNKIDEELLATALAQQAEKHEPLGQILVANGACTQEDIEDALRFQMEEEIYDLFTWRGAKFEFDERRKGDTLVGSDIRISQVKVNTSGLILEAMRRIDEWGRLSESIPSFDLVPVIPDEQQTDELVGGLTAEEKRILLFVDGANSVDAITRKSCLGRYAVTQFLARLFREGRARETTADEMRASAENIALQGEFETANSIYRRILDLDPHDLRSRQALAAGLEALGKKKDAAQEYNTVAEALCAEQEFAAAADAAAHAHALQPDAPAILERLASLRVLADQTREAAAAWMRLGRMLEEKGDTAGALEKVTGALEDLPEENDLRRMQARLLLAEGQTKEAANAYERVAAALQMQGDKAGAVSVLRTIVRLDSTRADIADRIRRLQMSESQQQRRRTGVMLGVVCGILLVLLAVGAGVNEVLARRRIASALEQSEATASEAPPLGPYGRLKKLNRALALIEDAEPAFALFGEPEGTRMAHAAVLRRKRDEAQEAVDALERKQNRLIETWEELRGESTAEAKRTREAFEALLASEPETEIIREAKEKHRAWLETQNQEAAAVSELLAVIGDTAKPPEERFAKFEELAEQYPERLAKQKPHGLVGLTLPVRIEARSNTNTSLPARVLVGGQLQPGRTPCVVEVPCDQEVPVVILRRGFGDIKGHTRLDREPTLQRVRKVELKRGARWTCELKGVIDGLPVCSADGKTIYVATLNGSIAAANTLDGRLLWRHPTQKPVRPGVYKAPLCLGNGRLIALDQGGGLLALSAETGDVLWPEAPGKGPLDDTVPLRAQLLHLKSAASAERTADRFAVLVTMHSASPLYAVDGVTGDLLWPKSEAGRDRLGAKIVQPLGEPLHLPKRHHLLVMGGGDRRRGGGSLHVLLEDGAYVGGVPLVKGRIDREPLLARHGEDEVDLFVAEEGVGIHRFLIDPASPLSPERQWTVDAFVSESLGAPFLVAGDHVFAGFESGRVARLRRQNGACPAGWDFQGLPGPVTGPMVRSGRRLLLTCGTRADRPAFLIGLDLTGNRIAGEAWRYPLGDTRTPPTGVRVFHPAGGEPGFLLVGAGPILHCLDDEDR